VTFQGTVRGVLVFGFFLLVFLKPMLVGMETVEIYPRQVVGRGGGGGGGVFGKLYPQGEKKKPRNPPPPRQRKERVVLFLLGRKKKPRVTPPPPPSKANPKFDLFLVGWGCCCLGGSQPGKMGTPLKTPRPHPGG